MFYLLLAPLVLILGCFIFKRFILELFFLPMRGKWVFITGCDSGFGHDLALHLLAKHVNVVAGCYTDQGRSQLEKATSEMDFHGILQAISLDITSEDSMDTALALVKSELAHSGGLLWGVVSNAGGFSTVGPDDWCTTKEYKDSLELNALGTVRVCHRFVPLLKKSKGRIVIMGSSAGRLHGQFLGPYCTAKFAVTAYSDCLRLELRKFGVSVHILEPGAFKTDLFNEEKQNARVEEIWRKLHAEVKEEYGAVFKDNFKTAWNMGASIIANRNLNWVVKNYTHALFGRFPRLRYHPGWDAKFIFIPMSLLPSSWQDSILSLCYRLQPGPSLIPEVLSRREVAQSELEDVLVK